MSSLRASELIIKPKASKLYLRLVFVLYLFTIGLVWHSSLNLVLQSLITGTVFYLLKRDGRHQSPCPALRELSTDNNKWYFVDHYGEIKSFDKAQVMIHNALFQLVQLSDASSRKNIVLFNDQLTQDQLRLLHLKLLLSERSASG